MSFACNKPDCPKLSESECNCPAKLRFCPEHMTEHGRSALCDTRNILKEMNAAKAKFQEVQQLLAYEKCKFVSIAHEMIIKINKMLEQGLEFFDMNLSAINKLKLALDTQFLDEFTRDFTYAQDNGKDIEEFIKKTFTIIDFKNIFTSRSLDEKKNLMINFKFQDFESIMKNQEYSIENILTTNDRKYLFLCEL